MAFTYNYHATQGGQAIPPRSPLNPYAQPFVGSPAPNMGLLHPVTILQRPPQRRTQHSPPRRAYHEAMTVSPLTPQPDSGFDESPMARVAKRIDQLQKDRKNMLDGILAAGKAIEEAEFNLEQLSSFGDTEVYHQHQQKADRDINEMEELRTEYGNAYEALGYEIEELFGEVAVGENSS